MDGDDYWLGFTRIFGLTDGDDGPGLVDFWMGMRGADGDEGGGWRRGADGDEGGAPVLMRLIFLYLGLATGARPRQAGEVMGVVAEMSKRVRGWGRPQQVLYGRACMRSCGPGWGSVNRWGERQQVGGTPGCTQWGADGWKR